MNKKFLILSIPIVIFLTLLGGLFAFHPQKPASNGQKPLVVEGNQTQPIGKSQEVQIPDTDTAIDTSNWKTYRNEEYGIEFKYPATLLYVTDSVDGADVFYIRIIQNGRTEKDIDNSGMMGIVLNNFANEKYGFALQQGLCESIDVLGKKGEVCDEKISDKGKAKDLYLSFIKNGTCSQNFEVIFFEPKYSNKESLGMNNIYFSCDQNNTEIMNVFQKIYETIKFTNSR